MEGIRAPLRDGLLMAVENVHERLRDAREKQRVMIGNPVIETSAQNIDVAEVPVQVIARLMGLPRQDSVRFQQLSIELLSVVYDWDIGMAASATRPERRLGG
jgi:hypothetical protein